MQVSKLNEKYGQPGRQVGNKLLYITSDGIEEMVHGYVIAVYANDMTPQTVYSDIHKEAPLSKNLKDWDDAHDALFGKPEAPRWGKELIKQ
jgi:hypothetical protein